MLIQATGLPRSGTAFLSTVLSLHPNCIGVHELAATNDLWRIELAGFRWSWPFVADCSTYAYFPKAYMSPDVAIAIKMEPGESVIRSFKSLGQNVSLEQMQHLDGWLDQWIEKTGALVVKREDLFTVETLKTIWRRAFGSLDLFSEEKMKRLCDMNIVRNNGRAVFDMTGKNPQLI